MLRIFLVVNVIVAITTVESVDNGDLKCEGNECFLDCDYGYVPKGKRLFSADDPDLAEAANCVDTMGFIVGEDEASQAFAVSHSIVF